MFKVCNVLPFRARRIEPTFICEAEFTQVITYSISLTGIMSGAYFNFFFKLPYPEELKGKGFLSSFAGNPRTGHDLCCLSGGSRNCQFSVGYLFKFQIAPVSSLAI